MRYAIAATALLGMSVSGVTASCQGPALSAFQSYLARFGKSYSDEREFQQRCAHFLKVSKRLNVALYHLGLASSLLQARRLIDAGAPLYRGPPCAR
jgi:ribosomal protein S4